MVQVEIVAPEGRQATGGGPTAVRFEWPGEGTVELRLSRRSVRSPDYRFLLARPDGTFDELPAPPVATYRGSIAGDPGSRAAVSILPEGVSGIVVRGDGTRFAIEALSKRIRGRDRRDHVVYTMEQIAPFDAWCGVTDEGGIDPDPHAPLAMRSGAVLHAELAIDCDWSFVQRVGGTNEAVGQRVDLVVNTMNLQYTGEVSIDHDIVAVIVRTAESDPYKGSGLCVADGLEDQVAEIWSALPIPHDIAHLFTGRVSSGTIGCNWVGEVCQDNPYGVSAVDFNGNLASSTDLVAHELGHGWGASHCSCSSPPYTMNPNITSANTFNPTATIPVITAYASNNDGCLDTFQPDSCGDLGTGDCFDSNGSAYCNNESCCIVVCAIDSFCCTGDWDGLCADIALDACISCGTTAFGSPFVPNGTPGSSDSDCCQIVCEQDSYCCFVEWDAVCVVAAIDLCTNCGEGVAGSAYLNNGTPGCDDLECCVAVCPMDPFCCEVRWDTTCATMALTLCAGCGSPAAGSPYVDNGSPGCASTDCCATVCPIDPFCCDVAWDGNCATTALLECGNCGSGSAGSAYAANGTPGCSDFACCELVCAADPACCDDAWDLACALEAIDRCTTCGDPGAGSPFTANGTPGCDDLNCCANICSIDASCCDASWDQGCAELATTLCSDCGDPAAGSCAKPNGSPGCADADCCTAVCLVDPFCCANAWDELCVSAVPTQCGSACAADLNGDGAVDGEDLGVLLGGWGSAGPGDLNGDGVVAGADLAEMLQSWGGCP